MKKTFKINISGVIFHIDEDAYEKLKSYLKTVELYFAGREGGKEIVDDIEARMAELFQERTDSQKRVISIGHVEEVTGIMGDPSEFVEMGEDEEGYAEKEPGKTSPRGRKRLYRDPENSVLGGVCGGIGAYFGIDPIIIRILFIILLIAGYGVWAIVYIILWIAIPKAVTISQRLEMRGERITVSSIEKTVKEEYEGVKSNFRNIDRTEGYKKTRSAVEEMFQVLGKIIVALAKVVAVILGIGLVFTGFVLLLTFLGLFFFNFTFVPGWFNINFLPVTDFLSAFLDPSNLNIILVALFFSIIIPVIAIIYGGIKLIFRLRAKDRGLGLAALIVWIVSVSVLFTMGVVEARRFTFKGSSQERVIISPPPANTLYLEMNELVNLNRLNELGWFDAPRRGLYEDAAMEVYYSRPSLRLRYADVDVPELIIERRSRGSSPTQAELNAERIEYRWEQRDSVLVFDNLFSLEPGRSWKFEELDMRLILPEEMNVNIGNRMERLIPSSHVSEARKRFDEYRSR